MLLIELRERAIEHGLADDQFTDEIHDGVNTRSLYAESGFGNGSGRGTRNSGLRCDTIFSSVGNKIRRLRFQDITQQFMLGDFCCGSMLDAHIGNDGRDAAALPQPLFRLRTGESGFNNLYARGGKVVFGAQGDDGAASMKNVSNELESRGPHQTLGINAQSDVVNGFAAMDRF